jgi:hypothetical protein
MIFGENDRKLEAVGRVLEALAQLDGCGPPDRIAAALARHGVSGVRKSPCKCPVHEFVVRSWKPEEYGVAEITVGVVSVCVWFHPEQDGHQRSRLVLNTPERVSVFMEKFDNGEYPLLVKEA